VRLDGTAILAANLDSSLSSPDLIHTLQLDIYCGFKNIQIDELSEGFLWTGQEKKSFLFLTLWPWNWTFK